MLRATIKNFSYQKCLKEHLVVVEFDNINNLPSKCLVNFHHKMFAISKWVSPKRTRSYPYARIYDTFDSTASKTITIIPLIKDEGVNGDMDYLQWDTISLMSLLNIYMILGFYDSAEPHPKITDKITNQAFNNAHITKELETISSYHQSALHWNLNQLEFKYLTHLIQNIKNAYATISKHLHIKMHDIKYIDKFASNIAKSKNAFMKFSRNKAKKAQNRESLTIQPKEDIGIGKKAKIIIENYLGGAYFFTIDDVLYKDNMLYLCESKHSKNALLPSKDDIKDGLLKLMLYNNIENIENVKNFRIILRLTSSVLKDSITLPSANLAQFLDKHYFTNNQKQMLKYLNLESKNNNFEIWIN